jgi:ornithine cyclodeaminase/alanine dehydrogenase
MDEHLGREILYLSEADVRSLDLSIQQIITVLEDMFAEKGAGRVEMPPKPGVHTQPNAFLHAMPAYIPKQQAVGIKWVGGYPENAKRGLPYISGLLILNDAETGLPLAVMDATWITAKRTGAATAVAAKYLARSDSRTVGILGCGVQGRSNLEALTATFDLEVIRVYDVNPNASERFVREMSQQTGLKIIAVGEPREAVVASDIVVTAGPILRQPHATIQRGWFAVGSFASLVDFDSYWHPEALCEVDKFCTDDLPQFQHYREIGYFQDVPEVYAELSDLVSGRKKGRESTGERTVACNLGIALDDIAVAPLLYRRAIHAGKGAWLPL